jgi:hypothetical protein
METFEAVRKYISEVGADGHSILSPVSLLRMGFSKKFVKENTHVEHSGKDYKSKIWVNGEMVDKLEGVYSLDFMYSIADNIGASTSIARSKMGRGFQAQELSAAIWSVINKDATHDTTLTTSQATEASTHAPASAN